LCPCITFGQIAEIVDKGSTCKKVFICDDDFERESDNGLIYDMQHVVLVGHCMHWFLVYLVVVAYTHASTAAR